MSVPAAPVPINHTSAGPYTISGGGNPGVGLNPTKSTNQKARGFVPLLASALALGPFVTENSVVVDITT